MSRIGALLLTIALLIGIALQSAAAAGSVMISNSSEPCSSMCADRSGSCDQHCAICPDMALGCRANASCGAPIAVAPAKASVEEPGPAPTYFRSLTMLLHSRSIEPEQHPPSS